MRQGVELSVAVVTVNWNGWKMTLEALNALRKTQGAAWHLVIVDNASSDDSSERLRNLGDDATLIKSPVNGGWTGGNNLGIQWAIAAGYRTIFILNNDALVEPNTIIRLIAAREKGGRQAIVGPIHLDGEGHAYDFVGTDIDDRTGLPIWKSVDTVDVADLPNMITTSTIKGAGIMIGADQFARIGLFDERFFLNFDETDWCQRARSAGYDLYMVKDAPIRHLGSGSIGGHASPLQAYFLARNQLLFAQHHCTLVQRLRMMRNMWWEARDLPRDNPSRRGWFWRFLVSPSPAQRAWRIGIFHYLGRRFGDCPPMIRILNQAA
jgi:hypothetical protein